MADLKFDLSTSGAASVRSDMAGVERSVGNVGNASETSAARTSKAGGKMSAVFNKLKVAGPIAAAVAGAAMVKFGVQSIKSASDVQQNFGALDAVFKRNSGEVKKWANQAATSVGLAKGEYAGLAAVLGAQLKNTGIKDFSGQTKSLIKLGADLSAQFGGSTKDAVDALGSALRGETDPIERYGVSINQAKINSYLLAQGAQKVNGAFTTQQQQTARLALIYQQTKDAQGAFGRESGTLAHQQQVLGARFENLKATIGAKLLPIVSRFMGRLVRLTSGTGSTGQKFQWIVGIIRDLFLPRIKALIQGAQQIGAKLSEVTRKGQPLGDLLRKMAPIAQKLAPIIGRLLADNVKILTKAIIISIDQINKIVGAIRAIAGAVKDAISWLGKLADKLKAVNVPARLLDLVRSEDGAGPGGPSGRWSVDPSPINFSPTMNNRTEVTVRLDGRSIAGVVRTEVKRALNMATVGQVYAT